MMKNKICKICLESKPLTDFYAYAKSSDGFQTKCKSCDNSIRAKNLQKSRTKYKEVILKKK
jgi:hypothetical protein